MKEQKRGNPIALLPIGVFLIIFIGAGILFHDFYTMPAIVGFLIALTVAFFQNRKVGFQEKVAIISKGIGEENIVTMCLIFLAAGAFSGSIKAAGGVESTVNLGLSIMPSSIAVVGLFIIGCFISISMGTSVGTITAMAPIGVGIAEKTGIPLPICMGAIVCGAMFGDNLSMISDTIFFVIARGNAGVIDDDLKFQIIKVIPYLVVLIGALIGINVFIVLITGTVLSLIVGVGTGAFAVSEMFQKMGDGITGMYDITVISIIVAAIVALVKEHGGIEYILNVIKKKINGERGGEFGISVLALLVDCCTANNTVAIVMAGPIAKEISEEFRVSPKRSASLLDIFASVGQGMIPYGAQLLAAASLSGLTPIAIMPYLFYPILMGVSAIIFIIFRRREVAE